MGKRAIAICGWNGVTVAMAPRILSWSLLLLTFATNAAAQLKITTTQADVPTGREGQTYSLSITAAGGTQPTYQYFLGSMGRLPHGLALNKDTGVISGTPTETGVFTFSVDVANGGHTAFVTLTITINPAITPTTTPQFIYNLPHWAAFGGWQTWWSIVDTSLAPNQCGLELIGPDGQPVSLETTAGTGKFIGPVAIAPWGTLEIVAGGPGGSLTSGASVVSCLGSANVSETYTFFDSSGIKQTAVSVLPTVAGSNAVFQANAFTGVAVWNSHPTMPLATTVYTYDGDGNLVGTAISSVPPRAKSTFNLNQVIHPTLPTTFVGSAQVVGDNQAMHVAVVGVQGKGDGGFITFNDPAISYSIPFTNYNGTYSIPNGQTGTVSINNLAPAGNGPDTIFFSGTAVSGSSSGPVTAIYSPRDGKLFLDFGVMNGPSQSAISNAYAALAQGSSGTNFSGSIIGDPTLFHAPGTLTVNGSNEKGFCWSDRMCSVKIGGDAVTKAQCKAVGGKSWSDPVDGCIAILGTGQ